MAENNDISVCMTTTATKPLVSGNSAQTKYASTVTGCTLLTRLPAELRNRIWAHAVAQVVPINNHCYHWPELGILRVCKQICSEAYGFFYLPHNIFKVSILTEEVAEACLWVKHVARFADSIRFFGIIQFDIDGGVVEDLHLCYGVAKLFLEVDIESRDVSTVCFSYGRHGFMQDALEDIVALGRKGRREGWMEEILRWKFEAIIDLKKREAALREQRRVENEIKRL